VSDPSPAAGVGLDPEQVALCQSLEIRPERCYLAGSLRITTRGDIRSSVRWPLVKGVGATSDFVPSIGLWYGPPGDAHVAIDLPGVPGGSTTPRDGDSAGPGEAQIWWSLPGSTAGYGHACTVRYEADRFGRLTGSLRCPNERTGDGRRYRLQVTFDAEPVVPGPLPTPQPTPSPTPPTLSDAVCSLLAVSEIEGALGLRSGSLVMLDAGPGQCVGLAGDREAVFVAVQEAATTADVVPTAEYRGASCSPLPLDLGDAASAGACAWPDGRRFVVGTVLRGSTLLAISLAADDMGDDALLAEVTGIFDTALTRIP
jgi:hypothetical protein